MNLSREELCILQQALGLRESTIINTTDFDQVILNGGKDKRLKETMDLRRKVVKAIGAIDKFMTNQNGGSNESSQPD